MSSRSDTNKSVTSVVRDITYDTERHYIGKGTFGFGLKITGNNPASLFDPDYFAFYANVLSFKREEFCDGAL